MAYAVLALTIFNFYLWWLGLCPANRFDEATADMITDQVGDLTLPLINIYNEKDETKKVLRNLMSVSGSLQCLSGFIRDCKSVGLFPKIGFQSTLRDIRELEQRSLVSYARKSEVNFLQCWFSPKQSSNFAIGCDVINRWIIGIRNKY